MERSDWLKLIFTHLFQNGKEQGVILTFEEIIQDRVKDQVGLHIDKVGVGDGLPEDDSLIIYLEC